MNEVCGTRERGSYGRISALSCKRDAGHPGPHDDETDAEFVARQVWGAKGDRAPKDQRAAAEKENGCTGFVAREWLADEDDPTCARPGCGRPLRDHNPIKLITALPVVPATIADATDRLIAERGPTHGQIEKTRQRFEVAMMLLAPVVERFPLLGYDVAGLAMKLARIGSGDCGEPEHWRDVQGYARLVEKYLTQRGKEEAGGSNPNGEA